MIRLLLVDDLVIFRQGLAALINLEPDIEIVGEAGNGEEAILLAETLRPDVILMDVRMPICNGVEATKVIHQRFPWIRIMVLTTFDEDEYICQSLQNGALGYILKSTPSQQLATTIRSLDRGFGQLDPAIALKVFARIPERAVTPSPTLAILEHFNHSEIEILKQIGKGKSNREIAKDLHLTEGTVKNYVTNILTCLNLRDRLQIALWVSQNITDSFTQI
ncbi:response regulator [Chamaesiphon minutus]|uniref:Response regulator containing a CheY-like receiver domain and an HTH DNA-binding domain n=1 Tax=Chamaesiphon minutus (strain ATCC 27169 / PCC 6605) TaxID=1173020 RepID=K9UP43_CHAP6|nr:response regulator transcription factor [Chamaesiphon minutus]AFY96443.1 response regulator containing a CheY-like receiver domain and an HTH DNA-binding domain [Chamaesiphon minutus PCC 6605]